MARILISDEIVQVRDSLVPGLERRGHKVVVKSNRVYCSEEEQQLSSLSDTDKTLAAIDRMLNPPEFDLVIAVDAVELGWQTTINSCQMAILLAKFYFHYTDEWAVKLSEELQAVYQLRALRLFYSGFNTAALIDTIEEMLSLSKQEGADYYGADSGG